MTARIIADSISEVGYRLTSIEVTFHRFVLAEMNTHRVFSRNSASSRAIPLSKQVARAKNETAFPVAWPAEQPGMQGGSDVSLADQSAARDEWEEAMHRAVEHAEALGRLGVHKSVANRLLEPFQMHTALITSTSWENFFGLRCNPMAQPEIKVAAEEIEKVYRASTPQEISRGSWHLPYVTGEEINEHSVRTCVEISSARCARLSYLTQDGEHDISKDLFLYERLSKARPMHASPMEHVATPDPENVHTVTVEDVFEHDKKELTLPRYGNLLGWHPHRFDIEARLGYQAFA